MTDLVKKVEQLYASGQYGMYDIVGLSERMQGIYTTIEKVSRANVPVTIIGESGTGKELVAMAIHKVSGRNEFHAVNCAALGEDLLLSELFGHKRGSFTGSHQDHEGWFAVAHNGTLFLDEILETGYRFQTSLLRVLQNGSYNRVGDTESRYTNARVIAAGSVDFGQASQEKKFNEALANRLSVILIYLPQLRERDDLDKMLLAQHFVVKYSNEYGLNVKLGPDTPEFFTLFQWPGNVRQMETLIQRVILLNGAETTKDPEDGKAILMADYFASQINRPSGLSSRAEYSQSPAHKGQSIDIQFDVAGALEQGMGLKEIARRAARGAERVALKEVLDKVHWNRTKAANVLKISYKAIIYKIQQCGLNE